MRSPREGVERSSGPEPSLEALQIETSGTEEERAEKMFNMFMCCNDSIRGDAESSVSQAYPTLEPFVTASHRAWVPRNTFWKTLFIPL